MELVRLDQVPTVDASLVCHYSRRGAVVGVIAAFLCAAALLTLGIRAHAPVASYLAAVIVVSLLFARRAILARVRPSNWLVRVASQGLFIQLRSHLNHHFPSTDRTVAFIPYRELKWVRAIHEEREIPDPESRTGRSVMIQRRRLVEFALSAETSALEEALQQERTRPIPRENAWYGSTGTRYQHYPVLLKSAVRLEIEWRVTPAVEVFLAALEGHVTVELPEERSKDYARLEPLTRAERETRLRELAESGETMPAIRMARLLYGYDLTQAKRFVEGLRRRSDARAS